MPKKLRLPALVHHKPTGQARVRVDGCDRYLGRYGSPEADEKYRRLCAEILAAKATPPAPADSAAGGPSDPALSVNELVLAYWRHAEGYYRKGGRPTSQIAVLRGTLRLLREHYGLTPAAEFGPLRLRALREAMVAKGWSRPTINARVGQVRQVFKWGVGNELVPPAVFQALAAVEGLRKGRSEAKEPEPVRPVSEADVNATLPFLPRQVRDMVRLQLLAGCRPGEVCRLRPCDVTREGDAWEYVPATHKTEHHGQDRRIYFGPRAQAVLGPYLENRPAEAPCFSPAEAEAERLARRHASRVTPLHHGNRPGTNKRPRRRTPPGSAYTVQTYRQAVRRACQRAGVPEWNPNQLRHARATDLRRRYGIEAARTVLGHGTAGTTELYAEADLLRARDVMREVG